MIPLLDWSSIKDSKLSIDLIIVIVSNYLLWFISTSPSVIGPYFRTMTMQWAEVDDFKEHAFIIPC